MHESHVLWQTSRQLVESTESGPLIGQPNNKRRKECLHGSVEMHGRVFIPVAHAHASVEMDDSTIVGHG
jgi:hypothetical protein